MATSHPNNTDGLKVIHASLFRMGTMSMATAYTILGYKVCHGAFDNPLKTQANQLEQAAEAKWPGVLGSKPRPPFTTSDWDDLWGRDWDIVTDLASPYVPELIKAYPNAKVVIVQRDFNTWWESFRPHIRDRLWAFPRSYMLIFFLPLFLGIRPFQALRKTICGLFNAKFKSDIDEACARRVYDAYFKHIRDIVPEDKRLEYRLGDGWEPLCEFLGVPVPNEPFPRTNNAAELSSASRRNTVDYFIQSIRAIGKGVPGQVFVACVVGWMGWYIAPWLSSRT